MLRLVGGPRKKKDKTALELRSRGLFASNYAVDTGN